MLNFQQTPEEMGEYVAEYKSTVLDKLDPVKVYSDLSESIIFAGSAPMKIAISPPGGRMA